MKKIVRRFVLGLVVLGFVGFMVLYFALNTIVSSEIESAATDALGVETTVGSVRIGILKGRSSITDLRIDNPEGYEGRFLTLDEGILGVNIRSVFSDRIEVKEITLESIHLHLVERVGGSNLGTILEHANGDSSKKDSAGSDPSPASDSASEPEPQKFVIDLVSVKDVEITMAIEPVTSERQPTKLTIDQIVVRDIGRKENGVTLDELTSIILKAIVASAAKSAPGEIPSLLLTTMEGGLSSLSHVDLGGVQIDLGTGLANLLGNIDEATHGARKDVGDTINDVGRGIEGLFGGSSEKPNDGSEK